MVYRVRIMPRAERDLAAIFARIQASSSDGAFAWYQGLRRAIRSLKENPRRCFETPENNNLRHLPYGHKPHIYRVICRIVEKPKKVEILHVPPRRDGQIRKAEV